MTIQFSLCHNPAVEMAMGLRGTGKARGQTGSDESGGARNTREDSTGGRPPLSQYGLGGSLRPYRTMEVAFLGEASDPAGDR
jgi:hypothetical protein